MNLVGKTANFGILLISNHNSFRVLFLFEKNVWNQFYHLYFSTGNGQPRESALCQLYRHTFVPYIPIPAVFT